MSKGLDRIREAVKTEPLAALVSRRENIVQLVAKPGGSPEAIEALILVEEAIGRASVEDQQTAVLKAVGYAVAKEGPDAKLRPLILDRILDGRLPRVARADELARWGEPGSIERYRATYSRIRWYRDRYGRGPGMKDAVLKWSIDLDYIANRATARFGDGGGMPRD